jgi:hypothetical protein
LIKRVIIPSGTNDGGENTEELKRGLTSKKDTNQKKAAA